MRCCGVVAVGDCCLEFVGSGGGEGWGCGVVVVETGFSGCGAVGLEVAAGLHFMQNQRFGTRWLRVNPEHLFV